MNQQRSRMKFTELDDIKLIQMVNQMSRPDWKAVSTSLQKWTPRQCRDRYNNYLSPKVQNKKWTKKEDQILLEKYSIFGPKWSFLTRFFCNRAAVNIKNHFAKISLKSISKKEKIQNDITKNILKNQNLQINDSSNNNSANSIENNIFNFDFEQDESPYSLDNDDSDYLLGISNEIINFMI